MGGVGEAQDVVAHELAGGGGAEGSVVVVGRDDGELLDDVPASDVVPCSFCLSYVVQEVKQLKISRTRDSISTVGHSSASRINRRHCLRVPHSQLSVPLQKSRF